MKRTFTIFTTLTMLMLFGIGNLTGQSYCLQLSEVSNDGSNYMVKVEIQGSSNFELGSNNLQFTFPSNALANPTLVSSSLQLPNYFAPTVTKPLADKVSLNIELLVPNTNALQVQSDDWTELAIINFDITDANAITPLAWSYDGSTTKTVAFAADESTMLFASEPACLSFKSLVVLDPADLDEDNDGILDEDEGACPEGGTAGFVEFPDAAAGTITNGVASADYAVVLNSQVGFDGVNYNGTPTGLEMRHQVDLGTSGDSFNQTITFSNVTPGFAPKIRMCQVIEEITDGTSAASDITLNWTGSADPAMYSDMATPTPFMYRFGAPGTFDLDNRQIIGLPTSGSLNSGDSFSLYAVKNTHAEWYVDFPIGTNSVTINDVAFTGGTSDISGIDIKFPIMGWVNNAPGEATREWISFKVEFVSTCVPLDSDGDLIPDYLDTDSDNDGCPDAIEAPGTFEAADLDINGMLLGGVDANGVPLVAGPAGQGNNADVVTPGPDVNGNGIADACDIAPPNDGLCSAEAVVPVACDDTPTIVGDNTGATNDGDAGSCWFLSDPVDNSVWYSVVVPPCGELDIETYDIGSNTDTQIAVFSSDNGACDGVLTEIGCNDDKDFPLDFMSKVSLTGLTPGETIFFVVDGYDGEQGTFDMSVSYGGGIPVNDEQAGAIAITMDNYWGVPGWDTFEVGCATESMPGCDGSLVANDTWYSFVAQSANTGVLAQPNPANADAALMDMAIEIFDATFTPLAGTTGDINCDVDRSCYNNYGPGEIERAVPTGLVQGDTYYYRVYDAANIAVPCGALLDTKVKTYVPHPIVAGCTPIITSTEHTWTVELPVNMYNIPPVPVTHSRLVAKLADGTVVSRTAPKLTSGADFTFSYSEFFPLLPNGNYEICAEHVVKMQSNGCINAYWSQSGPPCPVSFEIPGDVTTKLDMESCDATGLVMDDIISGIAVYSASSYAFNFTNVNYPANSFTSERPGYSILLGSAVELVDGVFQGLHYGQTYDVTVQAFINGGYTNIGMICGISINGTPPAPNALNGCGTGILEGGKVTGIGMTYEFGFYAGTNTPPNSPDYLLPSEGRTLVLAPSVINNLPFGPGETVQIYIRAVDFYFDPSLPSLPITSDWNDVPCSFTMPLGPNQGPAIDDSPIDLVEMTIYPNPNSGDQLLIKATNISDATQKVGIELYNMMGNKVYSEQFGNSGESLAKIISFENKLASGVYLVNVSFNGTILTERLIIQ